MCAAVNIQALNSSTVNKAHYSQKKLSYYYNNEIFILRRQMQKQTQRRRSLHFGENA